MRSRAVSANWTRGERWHACATTARARCALPCSCRPMVSTRWRTSPAASKPGRRNSTRASRATERRHGTLTETRPEDGDMKKPRTFFRLLPLPGLLAVALATPVHAQSLLELYEAARSYDATWQSAKAQYDANLYRAEQSRAQILPTANATAGLTRSHLDNTVPDITLPSTTQSGSVTASQPLYRPANFAAYRQGKRQVELAEAQLTASSQDLIVRVAQAYFDVLAAQEPLTFVRAQKTATGEQLSSAKRNFEVGTSTITDSREAQARFDLVTAQEIQAENDLRVKKLALDALVGKPDVKPNPLAVTTPPPPQPANAEVWVQQAEDS